MRFFIIYIACSLITFNAVFSQINDSTKPASNIEIFDKSLKKTYGTIEDRIILLGKEKIYYFGTDAAGDVRDFLTDEARRYLGNYHILISDSGRRDFSLNLKNIFLKTEYKKVKSDLLLGKKVKRIISVKFDFDISNGSGDNSIYSKNFSEIFQDTIKYDNIDEAGLSGYSFTRGQLPDETLLEKILVPGIVVITSAVAIILFFVIRSK